MVRNRVVLVHGTRMSQAQWAPYAELLPDAEVVAVDLPGHGAREGEPFTADTALATIDAAVAGAAPGQPVVLVGHSLGGYLAMLYAAAHPDAPAALVLVGTTGVPSGPGAALYRGFAALLPLVGHDRMAALANAVVRAAGVRGEVGRALPGGAAYAATAVAWRLVMDECRPALLRSLRCPVVLVNGQLDQMRLHVRAFAAECADARVVTVRGATHFLPLTHPHLLGHVLREVVAEVGDGR